MHRCMKNLVLLGLVLSLAACPGPGEGGSRLVGTWDEVLSPISDDEPSYAVFRDDGTFELDTDGEFQIGTFEETDDTLILTDDTGNVEELPYATDGTLFTPIGLRRISGGAGFAGQWLAEATTNGESSTMELVLGDDSRFTLVIGEQDELTGSWSEDDGELVTTLEVLDSNGQVLTSDLPWQSIDGTVSILAYERR